MGSNHLSDHRTFSANRSRGAIDGKVLFVVGVLLFSVGISTYYLGGDEKDRNEQGIEPLAIHEKEKDDFHKTYNNEKVAIEIAEEKIVVNEENLLEEVNREYKDFTVYWGETSTRVARRLENAGIIDDRMRFNNYMITQNYVRRIQTGTYQFYYGMTDEEIASFLLTGPEK
ncbi:hypothetical protein [Heliorestis convoluta]|uniref:Endolytic transglycosylase MltG n=1 Tax=Heliorestis convoluta TaxID=356322 RepID=A0A5Q2N2V0_9FIRM|nr:hypothetical protein [Heliorestis convoluta]QGG48199.1 hypothetical protein FTV88_2101 [Heliorestis convoluta]